MKVERRVLISRLALVRIPYTFRSNRSRSFCIYLPLFVRYERGVDGRKRSDHLLLRRAFGEHVSVSDIINFDIIGELGVVRVPLPLIRYIQTVNRLRPS